MYAALWRRLPGRPLLKTVQLMILAAAVVAVLFLWVFPAVAPHLPFEDVTIDQSSTLPTGAPT